MPTKPTPHTTKTSEDLIRSLGFESTEERRCDRLDFREVHVANLRRALEAAYAAGAANQKPSSTSTAQPRLSR